MSSNEILDRDQQPCSNGVIQSLIKSMSDSQLLNQIYETHLPPIQFFDPTFLFTHIKIVLFLATHNVDNALLGTQDVENLEVQESWHMAGLYKGLSCTLEQISSELAVKALDGASEFRETSMSILKNVSSYSWAAKAVLTLAAFAFDYGDFWNLSRLQYSLDQLAKAVGIEKVPVHDPPLKRPDIQKWEKEIGEVSNLIKDTLEVIELVIELERLSKLADFYGNILALTTAKDCIPLHAYWAIITVVACTTQMFYLSSDNNDEELELSPLTKKMNLTLKLLKKNIKDCHQQIEEVEQCYRPKEEKEVPEIPKKILEGFKAMIFAEENLQPVLTDGSTNKMKLENDEYNFFYGFTNNAWRRQFILHMIKISHDLTIKASPTRIKWYWIGEGNEKEDVQQLVSGKKFVSGKKLVKLMSGKHINEIFFPFKTDSGWVELRRGLNTILEDRGTTILKVLEKEDWKKSSNVFDFGYCLKNCYINLLKVLPSN